MQDKHLFEYAVIRIVPCVEREEFINTGVIVYCANEKFLQVKFEIDKEKLTAFKCELNIAELQKTLFVFEQIANGSAEGGAIALLPLASRFRWLTAVRSTIIQTSAVHPGLCDDAKETLMKLFNQLVK